MGVGVNRRHVSCKCGRVDNSLSTGYSDPDVDLMDVPDLFGEEDNDEAPSRPSRRRSTPPPTNYGPRVKDASVTLPASPVMEHALRLATSRGDIVTSGDEGTAVDGVHAPTSQHYKGTALDLRYATGRARQAADYRRLGYVVVEEATHLHVQAYAVNA